MRLEHTEPEQKDEEKQQSEKESRLSGEDGDEEQEEEVLIEPQEKHEVREKETRQVVTGDAPAAKAAALNSVFVKANAKVAASDEEEQEALAQIRPANLGFAHPAKKRTAPDWMPTLRPARQGHQ
ncbi:unnamed protein product [Durusdinium trenchii]|uniref:Uncharacterized protein n=2 Tax=Durusdinium trenchii TaxID=1381693 RepID=A0ABP0R5K9_9DINO